MKYQPLKKFDGSSVFSVIQIKQTNKNVKLNDFHSVHNSIILSIQINHYKSLLYHINGCNNLEDILQTKWFSSGPVCPE